MRILAQINLYHNLSRTNSQRVLGEGATVRGATLVLGIYLHGLLFGLCAEIIFCPNRCKFPAQACLRGSHLWCLSCASQPEVVSARASNWERGKGEAHSLSLFLSIYDNLGSCSLTWTLRRLVIEPTVASARLHLSILLWHMF